ncbi:hypothetical protein Cpir12675_004685 [Ceratocystis pirilliformis]|uniref:FAD dependent oxidoreductase domain-containing protein n=1 Tax=Ceratocystis pirilliformis TaxID=259994 RepID=A0ABR3YUS2_9PEZI
MSTQKKNIVIVGGGIIGCTTAYFLTRHAKYDPELHSITILEASAIAAGSSGRAGGLLAEWAYPECITQLSFDLHARLAQTHAGVQKWGYRSVSCGTVRARVTPEMAALQEAQDSGNASTTPAPITLPAEEAAETGGVAWNKLPKQDDRVRPKLAPENFPADLDYVDLETVTWWDAMDGKTAQVHPLHFTTAMAELATAAGVTILVQTQATKLVKNEANDRVTAVEYRERNSDKTKMLADVTDVVVATGPWTKSLLPAAQITSVRAHSVVYEATVAPYAVFTGITLPAKWVPAHRRAAGQRRKHQRTVDPEVYARPFGEVYACGETDSAIPLPDFADQVQVDSGQCDDITAYIGLISPPLRRAPIKIKQACYLPQHTPYNGETNPLVGPTKTGGLYVAAGHTCWGIQNGPATGCVMAEYILDGKVTCADVTQLDPRRYSI